MIYFWFFPNCNLHTDDYDVIVLKISLKVLLPFNHSQNKQLFISERTISGAFVVVCIGYKWGLMYSSGAICYGSLVPKNYNWFRIIEVKSLRIYRISSNRGFELSKLNLQ